MRTADQKRSRMMADFGQRTAWLLFAGLGSQVLIFHWWLYKQYGSGLESYDIYARAIPSVFIFLAQIYLILLGRRSYLHVVPRAWVKLYFLVIVVFIQGMSVGALMGNELHYIFSDAFRYYVSWSVLFLAIISFNNILSHGKRADAELFFWVFLSISVMDAFLTIYLSTLYAGTRISSHLYLFALSWALLGRSKKTWLSMSILLICIIAVVISGKRASYISLVIFALTSIWIYWNWLKRYARQILALSVLSGLIALFINYNDISFVEERFTRVLGQITTMYFEQEVDASLGGRIDEFNNVAVSWGENPVLPLLGSGFGAEVDMRYSTGVYSVNGKMHHAHSAWLVYVWRNGILGLLLLASFVWLSFRLLIKEIYSKKDSLKIAAGVFSIVMIINGIKSQIMLEDISLPLAVAFLAARSSRKKGGEILSITLR